MTKKPDPDPISIDHVHFKVNATLALNDLYRDKTAPLEQRIRSLKRVRDNCTTRINQLEAQLKRSEDGK